MLRSKYKLISCHYCYMLCFFSYTSSMNKDYYYYYNNINDCKQFRNHVVLLKLYDIVLFQRSPYQPDYVTAPINLCALVASVVVSMMDFYLCDRGSSHGQGNYIRYALNTI